MAEHMHGQDCRQPSACEAVEQLSVTFCSNSFEPLCQCLGIHSQAICFDVHKVGDSSKMRHGIGRGHETQGRQQDFLTRSDAHKV